jgi:hypothetical protein
VTTRDDFDRQLTAWLAADAPPSEPEPLLGQVLARTARTRRRPAWRIPERWIPMSSITTSVGSARRIPWQPVALVALLVVALVAALVLVAGAQRTLPAPFGVAVNGHLSFSRNGDIMTMDSPTANPRTLISGPEQDFGPLYNSTGDRLAFIRGTDGNRTLWAARDDGSQAVQLAGPFATIPGWAEWSPQGDVMAVTLEEDPSAIRMVRTDGSGTTTIQTELTYAWNAVFRPSDGRQLAFAGMDAFGRKGIYLVDRDGANLTRLELDPGFEADDYYGENREYYFNSPAWSIDGSTLMFHTLEPDPSSPAGPGFRVHVAGVDARGAVTSEQTLEFDQGMDDEMDAAFLPTGDGMIYHTIEGTVHQLWQVGTSPGAVPRDLGILTTSWIGHQQSPDGREVLAFLDDDAGRKVVDWIDLATGELTTLPVGDDLSWQRTAK